MNHGFPFRGYRGAVKDSLWLRLAFWLYAIGIEVAIWVVLVPVELFWLTLRREDSGPVSERLGRVVLATRRPLVVVHAVSVGEMVAAMALIQQLSVELPDHTVILTTGTRQARILAQRLRQRVPVIQACWLLPWDSQWILRRWLIGIRPEAVIVVETEIWPNLYRVSRDLAIPVFIVSGRIDRRVVWAYALGRRFFSPILCWTKWIGVQSAGEKNNFLRIGAPADRTAVMGNLKADNPTLTVRASPPWQDALSRSKPLIVAGSTHSTDERHLLKCLRSLRVQFPDLRLALAPRNPRRAGSLRRLIERSGLQVTLWSHPPSVRWDVLILDELGFLRLLYQHADIVVGGGTFAPRGGHNVLEAAALGRALIVGPYTWNIQDVIEGLKAVGAVRLVSGRPPGQRALFSALADLLHDTDGRQRLGAMAREYCEGIRGVAPGYARRIAQALRVDGPRSVIPEPVLQQGPCERP